MLMRMMKKEMRLKPLGLKNHHGGLILAHCQPLLSKFLDIAFAFAFAFASF
jgi:hypothetical protein